MTIAIFLIIIGLIGFIINKGNIILLYISIEILLLGATLIIIKGSSIFEDINGLIYSIYIIILAGAESAIGLSILVAYYRLRGTISLEDK